MQFHNKILLHQNNLISNLKNFKNLNPRLKLILVLKANAYGHGLEQIVNILKPYEKEFSGYQVDDIQELEQIRKFTSKKVFVLGYVSNNDLKRLVELKGIPVIYNENQLQILNNIAHKINKKIKIHLCIDSHLGRDGILYSKLEEFLKIILKYNNLIIDGYYSHFANIEDTSDRTHADLQIQTFNNIKKIFNKYNLIKAKPHISATSGILEYEIAYCENYYSRLGIGLYGLWPSEELESKHKHQIDLKPVMEVKSIVAQIKTVPKNYPIGYGLTYITKDISTIAIIPFGYSDGIPRSLSNKGNVIIKGNKYPIIGRISMNMMTVLLDKNIENIKIEDEVTILGEDNKLKITAEEIAKLSNTINYEILTNLGRNHLPRIIVK